MNEYNVVAIAFQDSLKQESLKTLKRYFYLADDEVFNALEIKNTIIVPLPSKDGVKEAVVVDLYKTDDFKIKEDTRWINKDLDFELSEFIDKFK